MLRSIKVTTAIADEDILKNVDIQKRICERLAITEDKYLRLLGKDGIKMDLTISFPVSYDADKKPMCWCNSSADGMSSNNSSAVTSCDSNSMVVRICGVESMVTFLLKAGCLKNNIIEKRILEYEKF